MPLFVTYTLIHNEFFFFTYPSYEAEITVQGHPWYSAPFKGLDQGPNNGNLVKLGPE